MPVTEQEFTIVIKGIGTTLDEQWDNAVEEFAKDPGFPEDTSIDIAVILDGDASARTVLHLAPGLGVNIVNGDGKEQYFSGGEYDDVVEIDGSSIVRNM